MTVAILVKIIEAITIPFVHWVHDRTRKKYQKVERLTKAFLLIEELKTKSIENRMAYIDLYQAGGFSEEHIAKNVEAGLVRMEEKIEELCKLIEELN